MSTRKFGRRKFLTWSSIALGASLTACGANSSSSAPATSGTLTQHPAQTITYAQCSAPSSLDTARSWTLETARVSAQVLEPLLSANPDTGAPEPCLAKEWSLSEDSLTYTFTLRENVEFHNGIALSPEAIRKNFERWELLAQKSRSATAVYRYLYATVPLGSPGGSLVSSVRTGENTVIVNLKRKSASFISQLTQPALGIAAPDTWDAQGYLTENPVGTGAFAVGSFENGEARLLANSKYWGQQADFDELILSAIPRSDKRFYALSTHEIDGYDQIGRADYIPLAKEGVLTQSRDPFGLVYVEFNLSNRLIQDVVLRRAIAHSLDRGAITRDFYPQGSSPANSYLPALFQVRNEELNGLLEYSQERAQSLLAASQYQGEELEFWYPTDFNSATLPAPEAIFADLSATLTRAGITIKPVPMPWSDYQEKSRENSSDRALSLQGMLGNYRSPQAFLVPLLNTIPESFSKDIQVQLDAVQKTITPTPETTESPRPSASIAPLADSDEALPLDIPTVEKFYRELIKTDEAANLDASREEYGVLLGLLGTIMPSVPLVYPVSAVALGKKISSYPVASTGIPNFANMKVTS